MQTQVSKTEKTEAPIAERIGAAQAMLTKLRSAADDADAEAARAEKAYTAHRTAELLLARTLTKDLASDAHAAAAAHETDLLRPLIRQQQIEERALLAAEADAARAAVLASFDEAADQLIAASQAFDDAISRLAGYHKTQQRCGGQPMSLARICSTIQDRFVGIREASEYSQHARLTRDARIRFANVAGSHQHVLIELVRPAASVSSSLW